MRTPCFWQSRNTLSTALLPAAACYGLGARLERAFTRAQQAPLPVISIGNVTAGGAGKTPTVMALIPLLQQLGQTPHILSRGYGGSRHTAHRVAATDDWRVVGDEPLLLALSAPTWVGARRIDSARAAYAAGATLVIADDALQHHALKKDMSLLVIDGNIGLGNGRLIPAGPLRESFAAAVSRADAVVLIGEDRHQLAAPIAKPVFRAHFSATGDIGWANDAKLVAFAGIAYPQKFYDSLRALAANIVATHDFPDHHPYTRAEIETLVHQAQKNAALLVTTAKDAVKIPEDLRAQMRVLNVALQWDAAAKLLHWLREQLRQQT